MPESNFYIQLESDTSWVDTIHIGTSTNDCAFIFHAYAYDRDHPFNCRDFDEWKGLVLYETIFDENHNVVEFDRLLTLIDESHHLTNVSEYFLARGSEPTIYTVDYAGNAFVFTENKL